MVSTHLKNISQTGSSWIISPSRGEKKKSLKPPPRFPIFAGPETFFIGIRKLAIGIHGMCLDIKTDLLGWNTMKHGWNMMKPHMSTWNPKKTIESRNYRTTLPNHKLQSPLKLFISFLIQMRFSVVCHPNKNHPSFVRMKRQMNITHRIHGTGIFTYIWLMFIVNVGI